jgi:hypothetical protein
LDDEPESADRAYLLHLTALVRAARGQSVADVLRELANTSSEVTDPQVLWTTIDAPAFAALAEGRLVEAGEFWRQGARQYDLKAHDWLFKAACTALQRGDAIAAINDLAQLDGIGLHTPLVDACRALIGAGLSVLANEVSGPARLFESALRDFRGLALPFEEALATIVMATLLDPAEPEVRAAADAAREILSRLGATPFLARLDAAMQRHPSAEVKEGAGSRETTFV